MVEFVYCLPVITASFVDGLLLILVSFGEKSSLLFALIWLFYLRQTFGRYVYYLCLSVFIICLTRFSGSRVFRINLASPWCNASNDSTFLWDYKSRRQCGLFLWLSRGSKAVSSTAWCLPPRTLHLRCWSTWRVSPSSAFWTVRPNPRVGSNHFTHCRWFLAFY